MSSPNTVLSANILTFLAVLAAVAEVIAIDIEPRSGDDTPRKLRPKVSVRIGLSIKGKTCCIIDAKVADDDTWDASILSLLVDPLLIVIPEQELLGYFKGPDRMLMKSVIELSKAIATKTTEVVDMR